MMRGNTEFHECHRLILPYFGYSRSIIAIIPTFFRGKPVKSLEISLEIMIRRKLIFKYS